MPKKCVVFLVKGIKYIYQIFMIIAYHCIIKKKQRLILFYDLELGILVITANDHVIPLTVCSKENN